MKYYCLGIKGTGMSTLAQILCYLGNDVYGYDDAREDKFTEVGLKKRGIKIYYDDEFVLDEDTIVTYSVALSEDHPEIVRAKHSSAKIKKYNEVVLVVDENNQTSIENVYSGGDVTDNKSVVCKALASGKKASESIIKKIIKP